MTAVAVPFLPKPPHDSAVSVVSPQRSPNRIELLEGVPRSNKRRDSKL